MVTTQASFSQDNLTENPERIRELSRRVSEMGEWFHNIDLNGVLTAPNHFLGDFPNVKWKSIAPALPVDLGGASVLDIGCNGGFHSIALKKRGAGRVLGLDVDDRYLQQARFASQVPISHSRSRTVSPSPGHSRAMAISHFPSSRE